MLSAERVSVVINTNGRYASLSKTLEALRWQRHRNFEVCVVCGPARDGTHEFIAEKVAQGRLKSAVCDAANLSRSRNIGIALAAGDYVAFIDDDALPEPVWLEQLLQSIDGAGVAGVSGLVFQPDGRDIQFRYSTCDRFGVARHDLDQAADEHAFPLSPQFPHAMGTNAMFRREALVAVGGFDEEYEYYLDEADLCCRLIDAGYVIRQRGDAPVHHKFLSGAVRDGEGITVHRYPILKNQLYFSLLNGRRHARLPEIIDVARGFAEKHRSDVAYHVERGSLHQQSLVDFEDDLDRAIGDALKRGLSAERLLSPCAMFANPPQFRPLIDGDSGSEPRKQRHLGIVCRPGASPTALTAATARAGQLSMNGDFPRLVVLTERKKHTGVEITSGVWHHYVCPETEAVQTFDLALEAALYRITSYYPFDAIE